LFFSQADWELGFLVYWIEAKGQQSPVSFCSVATTAEEIEILSDTQVMKTFDGDTETLCLQMIPPNLPA